MRSLPGATVKLNKNNRYTFADENLSKFKFKELTENHDFTSDDELAAKINARVPFSVIKDQKGRLRFGLRARLKNKKGDTSLGINILRIDSLSLPGYGWNTRPLITAEISSHRLQSAHLLCR